MSDRDERVEAAAYPIFVGAARAPWTSREDDEPCSVKPITKNECRNLARAALAAADAVQAPRKLVVDWTEDGQGIVCDPSTDPMRVVGTHGLEEPQPADGKRMVNLDAVIEALDDVASKVLPGSDPTACVRAAAGVIEREFGGSASSEEGIDA